MLRSGVRSGKRRGGWRSGGGRRRVEIETTNVGPVGNQCQALEDGQEKNQVENLRGLEGTIRHVERFENGRESVERGEGDLLVADRKWVVAHRSPPS